MKRLLPALAAGLMLVGCGDVADEEVKAEDTEIVEESKAIEEDASYFVDDIQTTFKPVATEVAKLTPEEDQIIREIEEHVNEVTSKPNYNDEGERIYYGDRELVEQVAGDYPEYTADELYQMRNDWYESRMYSEFGDEYIAAADLHALINTAVRTNLKDPGLLDVWEYVTGHRRWDKEYTKSINIDTYLHEGQEIEVKVYLSYNDDYSEATLERL